MPVWFLRHGESEANAAGVYAGRGTDSPLTALGREQARRAADEVPAEVTWIVASPLSRAFDTAQIVHRTLGMTGPVEVDDRAAEVDVGTAAGRPTRSMTATEMIDLHGAEAPEAFALRVRALVDDLTRREGTGLLVAHAGVGRMIRTLREGQAPSGYRAQPIPGNASLFLV